MKTDFTYDAMGRTLAFDFIETVTINGEEFNEWEVRVLSGNSRILESKLYVSPEATQREVYDEFLQQEEYAEEYADE